MGNLGGGEVMVILLLALMVLGPTRLPEVTRQVGKALQQVRQATRGFQAELQAAIDDPVAELQARARGNELVAEEKAQTEENISPLSEAPEELSEQEYPDDLDSVNL
ncbi:MAG: twin-arginine translocase TatA/TatE family subunit [Actinobacteria bacterium]|jgi:sec-independent protein translocase protein TatA|nr:twin-arginine translocase TatA/TatE family subunit [Actinomycetota bacterium]MBT3746647.1 twin-arginine translocase TatA/TatE family subunit [Actinomycetota bacterium]MBT3969552.1 twin-arginine translocase TatA/TatE family subunit [Actinomycetota bacterium]MBT4010515.1 twin-arginine translocase TatA/TatE family subunit [Actinomycetota bacterium]MBT4303356.1 twin-arginine translocase TatA/TatE family subunit [Actinomycetota bacterium]